MRVAGNRLQRDGQEFVAHGFNMVGLLTPTACGCTQGTGTTAHNHFNTATLQALTTPPWSANMLRFQVSQRGLADTSYSTATKRAAYLQEVIDGVATIRAATSATFPRSCPFDAGSVDWSASKARSGNVAEVAARIVATPSMTSCKYAARLVAVE